MTFTRRYTITTAEMDAHYRLTVDGLLTFHETTIATYLTTLYLAAFDLHKVDKAWVLSEINLELPEPPTMWSEDVEMTVWVSEMSPMRVWFDFTAMEAHTGKLVARGNSGWALVSMSERKLLSCEGLIPEGEVYRELAAGPHRKRTVMKYKPEPDSTLQHTINRIDLDFNGHTNNRRYIQMALVCFDDAFLETNRPAFLNIRFGKESRMGDSIANYTHSTDDPSVFVGRIINGRGEEICRVSSRWRAKEPLPDIAEVNYVRNPYR